MKIQILLSLFFQKQYILNKTIQICIRISLNNLDIALIVHTIGSITIKSVSASILISLVFANK